jgi:hypothetical protein
MPLNMLVSLPTWLGCQENAQDHAAAIRAAPWGVHPMAPAAPPYFFRVLKAWAADNADMQTAGREELKQNKSFAVLILVVFLGAGNNFGSPPQWRRPVVSVHRAIEPAGWRSGRSAEISTMNPDNFGNQEHRFDVDDFSQLEIRN